MSSEWVPAIAGLAGALIGGFCTLLGVQFAEIQRRRSLLLGLLIAQRVKLRTGTIKSLAEIRTDDHLPLVQAYYDLRSSLLLDELRRPLDAEWRNYKAGNDDFLPVFSRFEIREPRPDSVEVISHTPDYRESSARLDRFIQYLSERSF